MPNAVASSSRSRLVNGRANGRRRTNGDVASSGDEADNSDDAMEKPQVEDLTGWTKDTFEDLPIDKRPQHLTQFDALKTKLNGVSEKLSDAMERAKDAAKEIEEAHQDDELILEIEKHFLRNVEQRQLLRYQTQAIEDLQIAMRQHDEITDAINKFEGRYKELSDEYMAKTARQRFKDVQEYIDFRAEIWEINHSTEAGPPITSYIEREDGDESDDEDFEMGGTLQTYRCPVTLLPFVDPVISTICNHSYSRAGIENHFNSSAARGRGQSRTIRCPQAGCNAQITLQDLKPNKTLERRTQEYLKRQQRRAEEENDESHVDLSQA